MAGQSISSNDLHFLGVVLKLGLAVVVGGWFFGTWWICCSSHAMIGSHHEVFLEHEALESLRGNAVQRTRELHESNVGDNVAKNTLSNDSVDSNKVNDVIHRDEHNELKVLNSIVKQESAMIPNESTIKNPSGVDKPLEAHDLHKYNFNPPWSVNKTMEGTIFMSIAAYREQRGPRTIASAFEKAKNPDKLFIGLYQQWDPEKDPDGTNFNEYCGPNAKVKNHPLCSRTHHVSKVELHWTKSEGPCVARANAEMMYTGQEYAMQIDSHSTFVQDWDEMLIRMYRQTKNEFAVLSGYPRSEGELHRSSFTNVPMICTAQMLDWSVKNMLKNTPGFVSMQSSPIRTPYFGAGLVFAKGHRLSAVPYDPHLHFLFDGEEFDMAMRLFTHGYDVYAPNETPLFHFYSSPAENHRLGIQKFWDYQWGKRFPIMFESTRRLRHKMGIPEIMAQDPQIEKTDLTELGKYSPGKRRSVQSFLDYAGVDYINKKVPGACKKVRAGLEHVKWMNGETDPLEGNDS